MLTIGGWTGSTYFSSAVATEENRTAFVNTMTGLISKYDLDGLDFESVLVSHISFSEHLVDMHL